MIEPIIIGAAMLLLVLFINRGVSHTYDQDELEQLMKLGDKVDVASETRLSENREELAENSRELEANAEELRSI